MALPSMAHCKVFLILLSKNFEPVKTVPKLSHSMSPMKETRHPYNDAPSKPSENTFKITADNCFHTSFKEQHAESNDTLNAITSLVMSTKGNSIWRCDTGFYPNWTLDDHGTPFIESIKLRAPNPDDQIVRFTLSFQSDLVMHDLLLYRQEILYIARVLKKQLPEAPESFAVRVCRLPRPHHVSGELAILEKALLRGTAMEGTKISYGLNKYEDNKLSVYGVTAIDDEIIKFDFVGLAESSCYITTSNRRYVFTNKDTYGTWKETGQFYLQWSSSGWYDNPQGRGYGSVMTPEASEQVKPLILQVAGQSIDSTQ